MRPLPLPRSGPIRFDLRALSVIGAVRHLDDTMRRMRPGPRTFLVEVSTTEVRDAAIRWARLGNARTEVVESFTGVEVRIYLLPVQLGGHPAAAFSRPVQLSPAAIAGTSERAEQHQPSV